MRFRFDRMEIVYQVSAGIFLYFIWKYDESKEKGIACVALKLKEKEAQNQQQQKHSATTSSNSLYDADISDDH